MICPLCGTPTDNCSSHLWNAHSDDFRRRQFSMQFSTYVDLDTTPRLEETTLQLDFRTCPCGYEFACETDLAHHLRGITSTSGLIEHFVLRGPHATTE